MIFKLNSLVPTRIPYNRDTLVIKELSTIILIMKSSDKGLFLKYHTTLLNTPSPLLKLANYGRVIIPDTLY